MLVVGLLIFLVAHFRNPSGDTTTPLPQGPSSAVSSKVDQSLDNGARHVAAKFILTAVARKNVGESFALLSPSFKQTWWSACKKCDKHEWATQAIPVIPASFPIKAMDQVRFTVKERGSNWLTIDVALVPDKGKADLFALGLTRTGTSKPWLVDYWGPAGTMGVRANPAGN